jgi:hypothetical protein
MIRRMVKTSRAMAGGRAGRQFPGGATSPSVCLARRVPRARPRRLGGRESTRPRQAGAYLEKRRPEVQYRHCRRVPAMVGGMVSREG